jgi:hypothetical protein
MTVRDLMAGYTAYTDANELAAMRGTHRGAAVTTTNPTTTSITCICHDSAEPDNAAEVSILTTLRQVRENV